MTEMKQHVEDTVSQEPGRLYFDICVGRVNPALVKQQYYRGPGQVIDRKAYHPAAKFARKIGKS